MCKRFNYGNIKTRIVAEARFSAQTIFNGIQTGNSFLKVFVVHDLSFFYGVDAIAGGKLYTQLSNTNEDDSFTGPLTDISTPASSPKAKKNLANSPNVKKQLETPPEKNIIKINPNSTQVTPKPFTSAAKIACRCSICCSPSRCTPSNSSPPAFPPSSSTSSSPSPRRSRSPSCYVDGSDIARRIQVPLESEEET